LIVADITIHVEPAKGTLEGIDHAVMVLVEFLKVIIQNLIGLGVWRSPCPAVSAGVITLRLFQYSMIREVRLRLDDGWRRPFYHRFLRLLAETDLPGTSLG
jgi:hypothetical protein